MKWVNSENAKIHMRKRENMSGPIITKNNPAMAIKDLLPVKSQTQNIL